MAGRVSIIRPGLVVGAYDHTRRFGYWVRRAGQGGEMLAPESPDYPQQVIDARDLAAFTLARTAAADTSPYSVTGPGFPLSLGHVIQTAARISGAQPAVIWVDEAFSAQHGLAEDRSFPLYMPGAGRHLLRLDVTRAIGAGLRFHPFEDTVQAALDWENTLSIDPPPAFGLSPVREAELIAAWRGAAHNT